MSDDRSPAERSSEDASDEQRQEPDTPETEDEWRDLLTPEEYEILREAGTEPKFSGDHVDRKDDGTYHCTGCGAALFASDDKFTSGTGWPSFADVVADDAVTLREDRRHGMVRTEVVCSRCGGHLGHIFDDGPEPTGKRYCINSVALAFDPADGDGAG